MPSLLILLIVRFNQLIPSLRKSWVRQGGSSTREQTAIVRSTGDKATYITTVVECSCCFEQALFDLMIPCRESGHLVCASCLRSYVESQIFGNGNLGFCPETKQPEIELKCFHSDGCASGFHFEYLEKTLPSKLMSRLHAVQLQVNIEKTGLNDDVCTCPKCGCKAVLDPAEKLFSCPIGSCRFVSCRFCQETSHIPLACKQIRRLSVEEAMSTAIIRKCPACSQEFIKAKGGECNKVRRSCGTLMCYVCRKEIHQKGYDHFCRTPHCRHKRYGKYTLWTLGSKRTTGFVERLERLQSSGCSLTASIDGGGPRKIPSR
jgi:TRIAD3 protein (E3 ubiquitin-protein ligase RNF216)